MKNKKTLQKYIGCILCGVAKNKKGVIKKVLYEDKSMMVIMNAFPYNVGHVQVVPVRHVRNIEDLTEREYSHLFNLIRKSVIMVKKTFSPVGFNIGMNIGGEAVGGSINHFHVQVVPRYVRDSGFMEITASTKVMPMSLDDAFDLLKKHAGILKK
ncbi:MAG: HIT domain-containing protein [Candidatus Aenigmarchaeota archaeon]|nr:HIT domain-containing protein [Candidatus Aenigmarchaeota archaeon]